jgi:hypothetical protein
MTANIGGEEGGSEDDGWARFVTTGEPVSQEVGGRVGSREVDRLRPNVQIVSAGRKLVEWAR